jgi:hypothetical protein
MEANWGKLEAITEKINDDNAVSKKNNRIEQE